MLRIRDGIGKIEFNGVLELMNYTLVLIGE